MERWIIPGNAARAVCKKCGGPTNVPSGSFDGYGHYYYNGGYESYRPVVICEKCNPPTEYPKHFYFNGDLLLYFEECFKAFVDTETREIGSLGDIWYKLYVNGKFWGRCPPPEERNKFYLEKGFMIKIPFEIDPHFNPKTWLEEKDNITIVPGKYCRLWGKYLIAVGQRV